MPKEKMAPKLSSKVIPGRVKPKPSVSLGMLKGAKAKKNFKTFQAGFKKATSNLGLSRRKG
jgi:hypothetical protein